MKYKYTLIKPVLLFVLFFSFVFIINAQTSSAESPYKINIEDFTDKDKILSFNIENTDSNLDSVIVEVNGKKYTNYFYYISNYFYFDRPFPAGTEIKFYFNYKPNSTAYYQTELIKTITVKDGTPPPLYADNITVRTQNVNIKSEKGATVTATYAGKSITVTNNSDTTWKIKLAKPQTGKNLLSLQPMKLAIKQ